MHFLLLSVKIYIFKCRIGETCDFGKKKIEVLGHLVSKYSK